MAGPTSELATVTIRFACGQVAEVTAQRHEFWADDDGKPVPRSGAYVETAVPLGDPALTALLGEVNAGLIVRLAEAEARIAQLEAAAETAGEE